MGETSGNVPAAAAAAERVTVRPAQPDDAAALAQLSGELGYPAAREQVERRLTGILSSPGHAIFVADACAAAGCGCDAAREESRVNPELAGFVHVFIERTLESEPAVEVGGLVVGEGWRGAGIGRRLMERAECWARESGCATITVRSNVVRERAHAFYERLGYKLVKTQRVFRKAPGR
jgi:GNAT superfamily N-acetyltransferase